MLMRILATVLTAAILTLALALLLSGQAFADPWKDESGHGKWRGHGYHVKEG